MISFHYEESIITHTPTLGRPLSLSILGSRCDVNTPNDHGVTLLHEAALFGALKCVKTLLKCGAKISTVDNEGLTALDYAVYAGMQVHMFFRKEALF